MLISSNSSWHLCLLLWLAFKYVQQKSFAQVLLSDVYMVRSVPPSQVLPPVQSRCIVYHVDRRQLLLEFLLVAVARIQIRATEVLTQVLLSDVCMAPPV